MKIEWLGHACFMLTAADGTRILTDPFNEKVGYKVPHVETDLVTCSHGHYDHHSVEVVKGHPTVIDKPGKHQFKGISITGTHLWHDHEHGTARGDNTVFVYEIDGLRIAHMGDLGHVPDQTQAASIGHIDIMMIPVGGYYTIDAQEAVKVIDIFSPKIIIPMHFKTPVMNFPIAGVDVFLSLAGAAERPGHSFEITAQTLPVEKKILVLDYPV